MTIVTPDNLQLILSNVISTIRSSLKIINVSNTLDLTTDTSTINIGIDGYNKTSNSLLVFKDGILVKDGYTISTDSTTITFASTITATTEIPVNITLVMLKIDL